MNHSFINKRTILCLIPILLAPLLLVAAESISFTTTDGKNYTNVVVSKVTGSGIIISGGASLETIPFSRLPEKIRSKYAVDALKSTENLTEQIALIKMVLEPLAEKLDSPSTSPEMQKATAEMYRRACDICVALLEVEDLKRQEQDRQFEKLLRAAEALKTEAQKNRNTRTEQPVAEKVDLSQGVQVKVSIIQKDRAVSRCSMEWTEKLNDSILNPKSKTVSREVGVSGLPSDLADGDSWEGIVYPAGIWTYSTVGGSFRTLPKYSVAGR